MSESGRRPLKPLSPQLSEPAREFTEQLRRVYWDRTELNQRGLAAALHLTKSPVSRYLNGQEIIPADTFAQLCRIAGLTPREQQRLGKLREQAAEATDRGSGGPPQSPEPPETAVRSGLPGFLRRMTTVPAVSKVPMPALLAAVAAVVLIATAGIVMTLNGSEDGGRSTAAAHEPSSSPSCRTTRVYRVIDDGDILDGKHNDIGDVHIDDVFSLDKTPAARPYRFRDYGHVKGGKVVGYVDQAKLKPLGRRCVRDAARDDQHADRGDASRAAHSPSSPAR